MMDVQLRDLREGDLAQVMEWQVLPDVTRYRNTVPMPTSLEGRKSWYRRLRQDPTRQSWIIEMDKCPIGVLNIFDINFTDHRCSWDYYIAVQEKLSLQLATYLEWNLYDYVFDTLGLNKLCNETFAENRQMVHLHQICGSKQDGILRAHICKNGKYYDVSVGSILADEWREKRKDLHYDRFSFEKPGGGYRLAKTDHIGYLTWDIEKSTALFEKLGFWPQTQTIADDRAPANAPEVSARKVDLRFLSDGTYTVELVSPMADDSVVGKTMKKQGEGPYHLCFCVDDLEKTLEELKRERWIVVQKPAEAVAFGGRRVAFLFKKYMGLVELLEKEVHT